MTRIHSGKSLLKHLACIAFLAIASLPAAAQTLTSIAILGPATLNASATLSEVYSVQGTYSDGTTAPLTNLYWGVSSGTAARMGPGGVLTGMALGPVTLSATDYYNSVTTSRTILVVNGPDPNLPVPVHCAADAATGPAYALREFSTPAYMDFEPMCGSVVLVAHRRLNRIQAVDLATGAVLSNWQLNARPLQILYRPGNPVAFVVTDAGHVLRVDLESKAITSLAVGGSFITMDFGEPGQLVVGALGSPSAGVSTIYRVDADSLAVIADFRLPFFNLPDGSPIRYDPTAHALYVGGGLGIARLNYDVATGTFAYGATYSTSGGGPSSIALSPDGRHVVRPEGGGNGSGYGIYDYDTANPAERLGQFDTGAYPSGAHFRFDSRKLATSNSEDLQIFDVQTHVMELELAMPRCDYADFRSLRYSHSGRNLFALYDCGFDNDHGRVFALSLPKPLLVSVSRTGPGTGSITSAPPGIACGADCSAAFDEGAQVVLTATPAPGSRFIGWRDATGSAACAGTGPCTVTVAQASGVRAEFETPGMPGPPAALAAHPGDGRASFSFRAPAYNGGAVITGYRVSCAGAGGPHTADGPASPVVVTGLANGTPYSCTVAALNAVGTGASSSVAIVTPSASATLSLVGVVSRMTHGAAGPRDLPLDHLAPVGGTVTVEPRAAPAGHTLVFTFSDAVSAAGQVSLAGPGAAGVAASATAEGGVAVVMLEGVADNSRLTVTLSGVNGGGTAAVSIGFLVGEVTGSHKVNAADIGVVKANLGKAILPSTFRFDLNADGSIDGQDLSMVRARAGSSLR